MISRYLFWATLISITFLSLKEISQEIVPGLPFIDKFIHFFVYLFLSLLLLKGYSKNFSPRFLTILLFFYGSSIELLQGFTIYRSAEIADLIANLLGIVFGVLIHKYLSKHLKKASYEKF